MLMIDVLINQCFSIALALAELLWEWTLTLLVGVRSWCCYMTGRQMSKSLAQDDFCCFASLLLLGICGPSLSFHWWLDKAGCCPVLTPPTDTGETQTPSRAMSSVTHITGCGWYKLFIAAKDIQFGTFIILPHQFLLSSSNSSVCSYFSQWFLLVDSGDASRHYS